MERYLVKNEFKRGSLAARILLAASEEDNEQLYFLLKEANTLEYINEKLHLARADNDNLIAQVIELSTRLERAEL